MSPRLLDQNTDLPTEPNSMVRLQRRRAPYKAIAREARRLIIANGAPMMATEIWKELRPGLQDTVERKKLPRVLRRSKRAGLLQTSGKWWVRKSWLTKPDIPWKRSLSSSRLAEQRCTLRAACDRAIIVLKERLAAMSTSELHRQLIDIDIDERGFRRAMWNRAKTTRSIRRIGPSTYQWVGDEEQDSNDA